MTPAAAAHRLACSVALGGCLGILYGFLRPPGRKHRHLTDLVFLGFSLWVWLCICFALCRGDIRLVYLLGMLGGTVLWESTAGKWLRPVFFGFWKGISRLWQLFLIPWKKILYFEKILFASGEKWVTIVCTKVFKSVQKRRKESHGTEIHPAQTCESGSSSRIQYP